MYWEKSYKCAVVTVSPVILEAKNIILFNEQKSRIASSVHSFTLKFRIVLATETWCQKRGFLKGIA